AADALAPYADELFEVDAALGLLIDEGIAPDPAPIRSDWTRTMDEVFRQARLPRPVPRASLSGGRGGIHTEDLGHLLASLQYLARQHPGASW
ncbi:MAG: ring-1,2-phenylacetyl-CoA epoxidase subunit PaaC, partial [Paracoccaceae bacterium]